MTAGHPSRAYGALDFNAPMTSATADDLVAALATDAPVEILDIGCGWAELLLRLLAASPAATGHGVDHDTGAIERAARNAAERGLTDRVVLGSDLADAKPSDLVVCVGAEYAFGSLADALTRLRDLVRPGGRLLLGTLVWEQPPARELLEAFGDLPDLAGLVHDATAAGWRTLGLTMASARDWDHFELGFLSDWEQTVMASTDAAEVDRARSAADAHRDGYLRRRGVLGFAFLTLGRPRGVPTP